MNEKAHELAVAINRLIDAKIDLSEGREWDRGFLKTQVVQAFDALVVELRMEHQ